MHEGTVPGIRRGVPASIPDMVCSCMMVPGAGPCAVRVRVVDLAGYCTGPGAAWPAARVDQIGPLGSEQ